MRKWILVSCLSLVFVFGLFLTVQAKEITSLSSDNLGQIDLTVLREGPRGGAPVFVDDNLRVAGILYLDKGVIVRGKSGGDPVIIADNLRVDGVISRPVWPVTVQDDLEVTGYTLLDGKLTVAGTVRTADLKATRLTTTGDLLVYGKIANPRGPIRISSALVVSGGELNIPHGTSLPMDCYAGDLFLKTDTATLYGCTATDTWTAL